MSKSSKQMRDSEAKQIEADAIMAALARAGVVWDCKIVNAPLQNFAELTAEQKHDATKAAIDEYESYYGKRLHQAGEHEIADKYFKHPNDLSGLMGYLPK